jgi:precorrin-6B methylase 1
MSFKNKGSLVVVGTGISVSGQMTLVTKNHIKQADIVYVVVPNKPGLEFVRSLNPNTHSLTDLYEENKPRELIYKEMMQEIVQKVEEGSKVCAAFYGHPGVFVDPSHAAIEYLRERGFNVSMEPGISADACLIADLGIDPAAYGCQSYEATQFLLRQYPINPYMTQIIWQAYSVGEFRSSTTFNNHEAFTLLIDKLLNYYPSCHTVIIYEAKTSHFFKTQIEYCTLGTISKEKLSPVSTLVVPSLGLPDYDPIVLEKLNISFNNN